MIEAAAQGVDEEALVRDLADEFPAVPLETIRAEVMQAEVEFANATVWDYVGVLVRRMVRSRLRQTA